MSTLKLKNVRHIDLLADDITSLLYCHGLKNNSKVPKSLLKNDKRSKSYFESSRNSELAASQAISNPASQANSTILDQLLYSYPSIGARLLLFYEKNPTHGTGVIACVLLNKLELHTSNGCSPSSQ